MSNETYSVTITITSADQPSRGVDVRYDFSHDMIPRVAAGEELPASYLAAQDIAHFIRMAQSQTSFNYTDEELERMSPEDREKAIRDAAAEAVHTVRVNRID